MTTKQILNIPVAIKQVLINMDEDADEVRDYHARCLVCADSEWVPSLKMLAKHLKERSAETRHEPPETQNDPINDRKQVREYQRPDWLSRR